MDRFGWQEFAFQFTPQNSGSVFLRLMGPWDEILPGNLVIWKQEIFYDAVSVSGTASPLTNGGFESGNASWTGGTIVTETGGVPAVDGSHYIGFARTLIIPVESLASFSHIETNGH